MEIVFECVTEKLAVKYEVYRQIEANCPHLKAIASTTSAISPAGPGQGRGRPGEGHGGPSLQSAPHRPLRGAGEERLHRPGGAGGCLRPAGALRPGGVPDEQAGPRLHRQPPPARLVPGGRLHGGAGDSAGRRTSTSASAPAGAPGTPPSACSTTSTTQGLDLDLRHRDHASIPDLCNDTASASPSSRSG